MPLWSHVANRGTNTAKASATTLTISPSANVGVGAVLALFVAWDNNNNLTVTGPLGEQLRCTDDSGNNFWVTVFEAQDAGTDARCHAAIFLCQLRTALTTSSVITVTHSLSSRTAKACVLEEFALPGVSYGWASGKAAYLHTRAADPGAISTAGGIENREWLLLHALAAEGPSTDSYTWDSDYTQLTSAGTTGGTDDSNMSINPSYRIATLSSDTVDVTSDTADRDYTQGLVPIAAFAIGDQFPTSSLLDDFNRADDAGPLGSPWVSTCQLSVTTGSGFLEIISNQVNTNQPTNGTGGQAYDQVFNDADGGHEAWVSIPVAPTSAGHHAGVMTNGPEGTLGHPCGTVSRDASGYASFEKGTGAPPSRLVYGEGASGFSEAMGFAWVGDPANGYKIGIRRRDHVCAVWFDIGSGWEYSSFAFASTLYTTGRSGIFCTGAGTRLDDFGAGGYQPAVAGAQIYRRLFARV